MKLDSRVQMLVDQENQLDELIKISLEQVYHICEDELSERYPLLLHSCGFFFLFFPNGLQGSRTMPIMQVYVLDTQTHVSVFVIRGHENVAQFKGQDGDRGQSPRRDCSGSAASHRGRRTDHPCPASLCVHL